MTLSERESLLCRAQSTENNDRRHRKQQGKSVKRLGEVEKRKEARR